MSKGGMCRQPFAGFSRPDKLDPWQFLPSNAVPERAILMATILDAFFNYIYFGIGEMAPDGSPRGNGTSVEEFWAGYNYLFKVRSYKRETWEHARRMRDSYVDEVTGKRVTRVIVLTDQQLVGMCFDQHLALAQPPFTEDAFLRMVHEHRKTVLAKSADQIREYVRLLREFSAENYAEGWTLPLFNEDSERDMRTLLDPQTPEEVAALVGFIPKYFRAKKAHKLLIPTYRRVTVNAVYRLRKTEGPVFDVLNSEACPVGAIDGGLGVAVGKCA